MEQEMEQLIEHFITAVEDYAKDKGKQARNIKQHARKKQNGYKGISSVIEFETFKVRFAYQIDEGKVFKKGIVTLYFNIKDFEYHFCDILSSVAPEDKDCVVFPYVDNKDTMDKCLKLLFAKLDKYEKGIKEIATDEAKIKKLEKTVSKEIKAFAGKEPPKEGSLRLMLSGIYSNTSLIRYTSEPYEAFLKGNYKKALKLYGKESTLVLYEKQIVKLMKQLIKKKEIVKIPEEQLTINRKKEIKKESRRYTMLAMVAALPIVILITYLLYEVFVKVVAGGSQLILTPSKIFLTIPALALLTAFTVPLRDILFKDKIKNILRFNMLYKAKANRVHIWTKTITISSLIVIGIIAASSITLRDEGIKYSNDILDVKGSIVPYSDVQGLDEETKEIKLKNGEKILLETYDYDMNTLKEVLEKNIK